jgi:DNA polymerase IV
MIRLERVWARIVAHADMDAFYAAIEQLDDPSLQPAVACRASMCSRGRAYSQSYEARPYGRVALLRADALVQRRVA